MRAAIIQGRGLKSACLGAKNSLEAGLFGTLDFTYPGP